MLDEHRNLIPDDLQWFEMKILTQKLALFGFLEVERERKWCLVFRLMGFVPKEYKPATWVKSCWVYNLSELIHAESTDLSHAWVLSSIQLGVSVFWWENIYFFFYDWYSQGCSKDQVWTLGLKMLVQKKAFRILNWV